MSTLKHFNKSEYRSLGEALGDIQLELESLQVLDSSDIRWDVSNNGISAHLVNGDGGATQPADEAMDSTTFTPVTVPESHAPFRLTIGGGTATVNVATGLASRNGEMVEVSAGTITVEQAGYIYLQVPFDDDTGWGSFSYGVSADLISLVGGTAECFPLGYVEMVGGTVTAVESFAVPMAVFIKAGTCTDGGAENVQQ